MLETLLFTVSAVCTINYLFGVMALIVGRKISLPAPLLQYFGITFGNTYIGTPALGYQVYFWAVHFQVLGG